MHDRTESAAYDQLVDYTTTAPAQDQLVRNDAGPTVGCLYTYLVLGARTRCFRYNAEQGRQSVRTMKAHEQWFNGGSHGPEPQVVQPPRMEELPPCPTDSVDFFKSLTRVSLQYWNPQSIQQWSQFNYRNIALGNAIQHLVPIVNY